MGKVNSVQTFTDKKSSSDFFYGFNISTDMVNSSEEPYLYICKMPNEKKYVSDLIDMKILEYLNLRRRYGYVIICGKNSLVRHTRALLDAILVKEFVMVVQSSLGNY